MYDGNGKEVDDAKPVLRLVVGYHVTVSDARSLVYVAAHSRRVMPWIDVSTLVGVKEIAGHYGVTTQAVSNWRVRHPSFPEPLVSLAMGPVFCMEHVTHWYTCQFPSINGQRVCNEDRS